MNKENQSLFSITSGKGFYMTFDNGFTVSVQFGVYNYCENFTLDKTFDNNSTESKDAEVACLNKKGRLISLEDFDKEIGDTVIGYLNTNEVLKFMNWVANLPPDYVDKRML